MIKNKTIVIDPGHGGEALGAVGPNGLMEKDVNFRVAKFLAKKLQDAGAIVYMTRDGDYDVPLADRVEFAKSRKADAFVSIHHNANARRDPRINRSEIYCVFDPLSPSFDLGHLLYSKFREKLGLPILPPLLARYRVLKGNVDVAVLGEASYISNPEEEKRLADPNYNELEAEAYFEAIREYFERGVPKIVDFELKLRQNKAFARIEDPEGPGVDAGFVSVFLDGEAIDFDFEPLTGKLTVRLPELLPNGEHKLLLYARNRYGNITPKLEHTFTIKRPIVSFSLTTYPESGRNPVLLIVRLFDRYGMPIGEGERVNIRVPSGKILAIQPHADKNGVVRAVVMFSESESKVGIEVGDFEGVGMVEAVRRREASYLWGKIVDIAGKPIEDVLIHYDRRRFLSVLGGYFFVPLTGNPPWKLKFTKRGYYPTELEVSTDMLGTEQEVVIKPLFGATLIDRKILIDPAIGGLNKGSEILPGLTVSRANLFVAQRLELMLRTAGADVELTRRDDETTIPETERVKRILSSEGDLLISIDHEDDMRYIDVATHYYYRDRESEEFARRTARYMRKVLDCEPQVKEWSSYLTIHPPMTRIVVGLPRPNQLSLSHFDRSAYAIFLAVLEHFGYRPTKFSAEIVDKVGNPIKGVRIFSEEGIDTVSDDDGRFSFLHLRPEPQRIRLVYNERATDVEIDPIKGRPQKIVLRA